MRRLVDLNGWGISYSGPSLSVPRTGTLASSIMDVVYPTEDELKWVYFSLRFGA